MIYGNRDFLLFQTYLSVLDESIRVLVVIAPHSKIHYHCYYRDGWTYGTYISKDSDMSIDWQLSIGCEQTAIDITEGLDDYETKRDELSHYLFMRSAHELSLSEVPEARDAGNLPPMPLFCIL